MIICRYKDFKAPQHQIVVSCNSNETLHRPLLVWNIPPLTVFLSLSLFYGVLRCFEALVVYFKAGKREEPYVTISRKISLKKGQGTPMEWEIGQSERTLATHRNAFKRTAVIQAFLGSTPQLTLQLYATIQEKYFLPVRGENDYAGLFKNHHFICILAEVEIPNHDILWGWQVYKTPHLEFYSTN